MNRLSERYRSARRDRGLVVLEGFHALKHALRFGAEIHDVRVVDRDVLLDLLAQLAPDLAEQFDGLVQPIDPAGLAQLVPRAPATGIVALARRPRVDPEALLTPLAPFEGPPSVPPYEVGGPGGSSGAPVVLLERPTHLGNLGAVVRVAAAAGAAGVLCLGPHDPWSPEAVRGAAGLQFALPVAQLDRLPTVADSRLVGFDPEAGSWSDPVAAGSVLAFGSERRGLSPELLGRCRRRIALPMRAGVSSLNLATTVAAALYLIGARATPTGLPFPVSGTESPGA